jgi:ribosomal protein S13
MCDPGLAAVGAQGFGAGASTVGSLFAARSQRSAYRSQARIAEINARMSDAAARQEIHRGVRQEENIRLQGARLKSAQRARYAANGIDLTSETAQAALVGTDLITEVDANTARANAIQAAWGRRTEAGNLRSYASGLRASASSVSPFLSAFGSFANAAGQVAQSWYALRREGFGSGPASGRTG